MEQSGGGLAGLLGLIIPLGIILLMIVSAWKVFTKAGQPGWASIIPIYNLYVMLQIVSKPTWWIILFIIPLVNFVVSIIVWIAMAKCFNKGTGYGLGLAFLTPIFLPLLAFSDATYSG